VKTPKPKILLTGRPGVGKTTVVKKVAEGIRDRAGGFYTEEIREKGKRKGFLIRTLRGECGILAHVNHHGPFRVGRYGVDVDRFEEIVASCLESAVEKDEVIIIDEIGKMELFSHRFRQLVEKMLASDKMVLAVIHQRNDSFTRRIRLLPNIREWTVTEKNRDDLPSHILKRMNLG
jgi:nucleoside-triphosphatase